MRKSSVSRNELNDSSSVKVYGEDEWKARQPGAGKRLTWRELRLCDGLSG
jgi:hypothetical protein